MKFLADFELAEEILPMDWRRCILSYLKLCLSKANEGKYFDEYYGPAKEKPFCFSVVFDHPVFLKDTIEVRGKRMRLVISTADSRTGFILFSAVIAQKSNIFLLPMGNSMHMTRTVQLKDSQVHSDKILVKMLEPLCIRKHDRETNRDWYYSQKQEGFEEESRKVIRNQLLSAGFSENLCGVRLTPVNARTVIVRFYDVNIESSLGDFMLEGDKAVLNYLLQSGLGSRRSSGFGVAQLLAEG